MVERPKDTQNSLIDPQCVGDFVLHFSITSFLLCTTGWDDQARVWVPKHLSMSKDGIWVPKHLSMSRARTWVPKHLSMSKDGIWVPKHLSMSRVEIYKQSWGLGIKPKYIPFYEKSWGLDTKPKHISMSRAGMLTLAMWLQLLQLTVSNVQKRKHPTS